MSYETKIEAKNAAERAGRRWAISRGPDAWLERLAETFHESSGVLFNPVQNNPYVICYLAITGAEPDELDPGEVRDFWEGALGDDHQKAMDDEEFFEDFITGAVDYHDEVTDQV